MSRRLMLMLAVIAGALLGAPVPASAEPAGTGKYYVVGEPVGGQREYLFAIALKTLGDGNRYPEIVELNRGRPQPDGGALVDPTDVRPGWILVLPADAAGPSVRTGPLPSVSTAADPPVNAVAGPEPAHDGGRGNPTLFGVGTGLVVAGALALTMLAVRAGRRPAPAGAPGVTRRRSAGGETTATLPSGGTVTQRTFSGPTFAEPVAERTVAGPIGEASSAATASPAEAVDSRVAAAESRAAEAERRAAEAEIRAAAIEGRLRAGERREPPVAQAGEPAAPQRTHAADADAASLAPVPLDVPADGPIRLGTGGLVAGLPPADRRAADPDASNAPGPESASGPGLASGPGPASSHETAPDTEPAPGQGAAFGPGPAPGPKPASGPDVPAAPVGDKPPLPAPADRAPEVRETLDAGTGPVRVRLLGATRAPAAPAYAWLADGETPPPAAVPLVLGRRGGWRLHVDLARTPDVVTIVGPEDDRRRQAAAFARTLHESGVDVAVVGDTLGAEPPAGVRRIDEFPPLPPRGAAPSAPHVVICERMPAHARRMAVATGGRAVPVLVGDVPAARWSIQLGGGAA
ncbi:hypothetical protein [Catenuloplanes atrovinosus]|uniref:Uncharacterized protein n=1 Tax=Catenuloplanes atrovinosus TaxID=137266 RepID=A0AAE3YKK2_9ACTN|nr:hypothetical protein [Catenuloplanes atrovinosus]MDR7274232.1 hypothetical protein [Catenuloplanes atrovinosus]